jgi:hypothetical protein
MTAYTEQLQRIVKQYQDAGQPWPASARQMAAWAIRNRLWEPQQSAMITRCAEELARAMREEYIRDPQGRSVRAKHAARIERDGEQYAFWADIRSATKQHMEIAFQQRRLQVLGECRQLKTDVDSYNENRNQGAPIQMIFDFTLDLQELDSAA